jgi:hypothetical protein
MDAITAENVLWSECFRNWSLTGLPIPLPILKRRCQARFPNADADLVVRKISERMDALRKEHSARQSSSWR